MIPLSAPVRQPFLPITFLPQNKSQYARLSRPPWVGKSVILSGRISTGVKRDYMCYEADLRDVIVKQGTLISFSSELLVSHIIPLSVN